MRFRSLRPSFRTVRAGKLLGPPVTPVGPPHLQHLAAIKLNIACGHSTERRKNAAMYC